jgi:hypothetical protein
MGASSIGAPGNMSPAKMSTSGVFKGDGVMKLGTDKRPEFTNLRANGWCLANDKAALRNNLLVLLLGVMKSVERVEFKMFSSAA